MMHLLLISSALNKMITAFSWMLIHSLWQGLFFAIVTGIVLLLSKRSAAAHRYNLVLIIFFAFITACALTFTYEWKSESAAAVLTPIAGNIPVNVSSLLSGNAHNIKQVIHAFTAYFSANAPFIILLWFMVFLFKSVKMISCLAYNQRIRNYQVYQPSVFWEEKVALFSKKLNIRRAVRLLQSGYVKMPVVVGHLKPVILIPVGLMAGLPVEQVEAILLHELAHIKRNDYFVNFFQNVAEAVFFFNPGLLWISSLLREERENCADDIAVAETNNKIDFVQALVSFKEHQLYGAAYATAFAGKKNYLLRRASRILGNQHKTFGLGEKIFFTASILLFGLVVTGAAVARVKEYKKETARVVAGYNEEAKQPGRVNPAAGAEKARRVKHHRSLVGTIKMKPGIAGINENAVPERKLSDNPEQVVAVNPAPAPVEAGRTVEAPGLQADNDRITANLNRAQAEEDRRAADRSRMQAIADRMQAEKDRAQAILDRAQADKDRAQAAIDRAQADKDRLQAVKDRAQADRDREQWLKNKADAEIQKKSFVKASF